MINSCLSSLYPNSKNSHLSNSDQNVSWMPVCWYGCVTHGYWFQSTDTLRYDWGTAIFVGPLHDEMPLEPLRFTEPMCGSNRPGLTQMARAQLPMQHNINRSILANGSAAFIWKLHWHWLNACNNISLLHNTGMSDVKFGYFLCWLLHYQWNTQQLHQ